MLASIAAWKVDIDAELNDSGTDVEIDPIAIMVSCGYKF
jgi:outer membrane protein W